MKSIFINTSGTPSSHVNYIGVFSYKYDLNRFTVISEGLYNEVKERFPHTLVGVWKRKH